MEPPRNIASKSPLFGAVGSEGMACPIKVETPKCDRCWQVRWNISSIVRDDGMRPSEFHFPGVHMGKKKEVCLFFLDSQKELLSMLPNLE